MNKNKILLAMSLSLPLVLVGCGNSDNDGSGGGVAGISSGTITGFGSVFVNGVRFNTDTATVTSGGNIVNRVQDLDVGMIVRVEGDMTNRIASSVTFEEELTGPADGSVTNGRLSVMGQTIIINAATRFDDDLVATNIAAGNILEISGLRNADDDIVASYIDIESPADVSEFSVIGNVRDLDTAAKTFKIDGLLIDYSTADVGDLAGGVPVEGQLVEVEDNLKRYVSASGEFIASEVDSHNRLGDSDLSGKELELEGIVTRLVSEGEFEMGGLTVQHVSASTEYLYGLATDIVLGAHLEVEGQLDSGGVLQAEEIEFEDNESSIEATVESVNVANNTLTLLGITVHVTNETELQDERDASSGAAFSLADIVVGEFLEIEGFIAASGDFIVSELTREDAHGELEVRGAVTAKDAVAGTVTILGKTVNTNTTTKFEGLDDALVTADKFFDDIVVGLTVVEATWEGTDATQAVYELSLDD